MALTDEVESRYGAQFLVNLTNPYDDANAIDTTRFGLAATDVEDLFKIFAGLVYDSTDGMHNAIAVEGVIVLLKIRTGLEKGSLKKEWVKEFLVPLSLVTSRDRVGPVTSSVLTQSTEESGAKPHFDNERFADVLPTVPSARGDIDRTD